MSSLLKAFSTLIAMIIVYNIDIHQYRNTWLYSALILISLSFYSYQLFFNVDFFNDFYIL